MIYTLPKVYHKYITEETKELLDSFNSQLKKEVLSDKLGPIYFLLEDKRCQEVYLLTHIPREAVDYYGPFDIRGGTNSPYISQIKKYHKDVILEYDNLDEQRQYRKYQNDLQSTYYPKGHAIDSLSASVYYYLFNSQEGVDLFLNFRKDNMLIMNAVPSELKFKILTGEHLHNNPTYFLPEIKMGKRGISFRFMEDLYSIRNMASPSDVVNLLLYIASKGRDYTYKEIDAILEDRLYHNLLKAIVEYETKGKFSEDSIDFLFERQRYIEHVIENVKELEWFRNLLVLDKSLMVENQIYNSTKRINDILVTRRDSLKVELENELLPKELRSDIKSEEPYTLDELNTVLEKNLISNYVFIGTYEVHYRLVNGESPEKIIQEAVDKIRNMSIRELLDEYNDEQTARNSNEMSFGK